VRVKISYGAEMEEVPEEIDQLYTYVSDKVRKLQSQSEKIENLLSEEEIEATLSLMDKMRRSLAAVDKRLSDIEMIGTGYLNHIKGEEDVSNRRPSVDPSGFSDAITDT
jgi:uncharacterized protein (UPF0305 family)